MGNVFKSDEVYKHLKYDLHDRNEIVPVRGVYITGVYSPPYYNEPIIRIDSITSTPATLADLTETDRTNGNDPSMKILDFSLTLNELSLTNYTVADLNPGSDTFMKIVDFSLTPATPPLTFYESTNRSSGSDTFMKILDFSCSYNGITSTIHSIEHGHSTPEPILRLTGISSGPATIADVVS